MFIDRARSEVPALCRSAMSVHSRVEIEERHRQQIANNVKIMTETRHNLIYRPFLLDGTKPPFTAIEGSFAPYWEDCTLTELIGRAPGWQEIEVAYEHFATAMWEWRNRDRRLEIPPNFIFRLFEPYTDRSGERPTETVLLRYARMLSGNDQPMLDGLVDYRNKLVDQDGHAEQSGIGFPPEWKLGEI